MEAYSYLQAAAEGRGLLRDNWRRTVSAIYNDAKALYRDRTRSSVTVMDLLASAIAKRRLGRATGAMAADKSYYLRLLLPKPFDSLAYYAGVVKEAYATQARRSGTALETIGIEQPVAAAVDDAVEQEFLLYLLGKVSAEHAPEPYTRRGRKLTRQWRAYVRGAFGDFTCRRLGVRVALSQGCPAR